MGLTWVNDLTKRMGRIPQNKWDGLVCQSHQNFPTSEEVPCFPGPIRTKHMEHHGTTKQSSCRNVPNRKWTRLSSDVTGGLVLPSHDFMCSSSRAISWSEELQETLGFGGEKTMGFL
jgi:hypothetical protein